MRWIDLQKILMEQLEKRSDLQSILYLIGVDEMVGAYKLLPKKKNKT